MTKAIMNTILSVVSTIDTPEAEEIRTAINAELARGEAKAKENRDLYASTKETILGAHSETPVTISELYEEIKDALPSGFSKAKVQYAITRLWSDEVTKIEGKVNSYAIKA